MRKFIPVCFLAFLFVTNIYSQVPYYYYPVQSGTNNNLNSMTYYNSSYIIIGNNGTSLKSTNYGAQWNTYSVNSVNNLNSFLSENFFYGEELIFGNNGTILKTSNNGLNWVSDYSGLTNNFNSGTFIFSYFPYYCQSYIAVGSGGVILYKRIFPDSTVWTQVYSGVTNDLNAVSFVENYGYIVGKSGKILVTTDAGNNWISKSSGTTNDLNSVFCKDFSEILVAGNSGTILKSINAGNSWTQVASNTTQNLQKIFLASNTDSNQLCIVGNNVVLFSSNGINSWISDNNVPNVNLKCGSYVSQTGEMILAGDSGKIFVRKPDTVYHPNYNIKLDANKISSYFSKTGTFNHKIIEDNSGFEWPKDSGTYAVFSSGLNIAAKVNGLTRMAACSYKGEYAPGYCLNGEFHTNLYFKIYKVNKSDNSQTNWDWANWGQMVPYGAPFIDVNSNGTYEPLIDTPGVKNAKETLFLCMTDADPSTHTENEGFGGGSEPLGAELHMTAWAYDTPALQNVQFINYVIINHSNSVWTSTQIGVFSDADLGDANDDYIGCDTVLKLGYCYNADDFDTYYKYNPPAVGITFLRCSEIKNLLGNINLGITSLTFCTNTSSGGPPCESDPYGELEGAYNILSGYKKDLTSFLDPTEYPYKKTKFCYFGNPETYSGWTEFGGSVQNCGGDTDGVFTTPNPPGDRRFIMSSGSDELNVNPGDTQKIVLAQLIARGSSNLNSVTQLKNLTAQVRNFYETNFPISVNNITTKIPKEYILFQNYPNPFNPSTKIKYQIPKNCFVNLKVYDVLGREVAVLVNEFQSSGIYETQFPNNLMNNNKLSSGIYFYRLQAGDFSQVKRMVLIK